MLSSIENQTKVLLNIKALSYMVSLLQAHKKSPHDIEQQFDGVKLDQASLMHLCTEESPQTNTFSHYNP